MPVTDPGVTGHSGAGLGLFAGWRAEHERDLFGKIVEVWLDQTKFLSMAPRRPTNFRRIDWPVYVNQNVEDTPQLEAIEPSDLPFFDAESELLNNATTILNKKIGVSISQEANVQNWVPSNNGRFVRLAIQEMLRGIERLLWSGEFSDPGSSTPARSNAGFGVDAAGTGLETLASAKWTTDITDTNIRMTQTDQGAVAIVADDVFDLHEAITDLGGVPSDMFVDPVNKRLIDNEFSTANARERVNWQAGTYKSETSIEHVQTPYGQLRVHLCRRNFPNRALFMIDMDPEKIAWGPKKGAGMQLVPQGIRGTLIETIVNVEFSLWMLAPHAHGFLYNTGT